jgi:hypothetical protein
MMPQSSTNFVAHIVQIPVLFEFRKAKIQWGEARAKVVGWRDDNPGQKMSLHLIAEVHCAGQKSRIAIPLVKLPEQQRKECLPAVGKPQSHQRVREICSSLELPYFVHNTKTHFPGDELRKNTSPGDAWLMRDEFLSLKGDREKTLAFLNKWGRWAGLRSYVDFTEIANLQEEVRTALTKSPDEWFSTLAFPTMVNSRSTQFPYFTMLTDACQVAIRMATTIDLLQHIEFKTCARLDCAKPFAVRSKRKRDYCSQYCAHLESVRRGRASQRSV